MFVVMSHAATEAEVLGVKSRILAEGLTPYEHAGSSGTVLAVVGEVAGRREQLMSQLGAMAGVETVTPISKPFKLTSREFHPENRRGRGCRRSGRIASQRGADDRRE